MKLVLNLELKIIKIHFKYLKNIISYEMALHYIFETLRKHLIFQPIVGNLPAIGCLVSFEYGYDYNS